jgi:putative acetyltransferase
MMTPTTTQERSDTPEATGLIAELDTYLHTLYPPESRHGLSVADLLHDTVTFFVSRCDGVPAGCVAVKVFDSTYPEVKPIDVRPAYRGLGLGRLILNHIQVFVREQGLPVLHLETGIHQPEAIRLFERSGFRRIPPFGSYRPDPRSLFYEKRLV